MLCENGRHCKQTTDYAQFSLIVFFSFCFHFIIFFHSTDCWSSIAVFFNFQMDERVQFEYSNSLALDDEDNDNGDDGSQPTKTATP